MSIRIDFDEHVRCADGDADVGRLAAVVIDAETRRLTHLVVETSHGHAHLVPTELVDAGRSAGRLTLSCSTAEFAAFGEAHKSAYVGWGEEPEPGSGYDVGVEDVTAVPLADAGEMGGYVAPVDGGVVVAYDRIPSGCVELRASSDVLLEGDHPAGHVAAWVVDGDEIERLLLHRGHLWRARLIAVPMAKVARMTNDAVTVALTPDELDRLPAEHRHPWPFAPSG